MVEGLISVQRGRGQDSVKISMDSWRRKEQCRPSLFFTKILMALSSDILPNHTTRIIIFFHDCMKNIKFYSEFNPLSDSKCQGCSGFCINEGTIKKACLMQVKFSFLPDLPSGLIIRADSEPLKEEILPALL